jgi:Fic family protein
MVSMPTGYRAYVPIRLPPSPSADLAALEPISSEANLALGRLDGVADVVPDPELFVRMYVKKEAVLSSQIEGTQASLDDIFAAEVGEADDAGEEKRQDVREVNNYVEALSAGLRRLESLPLSLRLLCEMHAILMSGVRGKDKTPGEFRRSQNWIGPPGASLATAAFVPPPPDQVLDHMGDLEKFFRVPEKLPVLVRVGMAHAHFETIHPFLDGNGRLGRLLMTFMLCERGVLRRPLLYLSAYLTANKQEYYDRLMAVRFRGEWEAWLVFLLTGVRDVANAAVAKARAITELREKHARLIREKLPHRKKAMDLLDHLLRTPRVNVLVTEMLLDVTNPTANALVADFESIGILREVTGRMRDRVFRYDEYINILNRD